jgi:AcrR family transcriptional regulator
LNEILVHEGQLLLNSLGAASSGSRTYFELEERSFTAFARYIARKPRFLRVLIEAEVAAPASYAEHMGNIERRYLAAFNRAVASNELRPQSDEAFRVVAEILSGSRGHIAIGFSGRGARVIPGWAVDAYVRFVRQGLDSEVVSLLPPPQPSRPRINPSDTRSALFHAAAEVVLEHGYGGATVAAITERAGFAVGTFYTHFESRQELLNRLLAYVRANMLEEVRAAIHGSHSFLEMEVRAFRAYFDHLSRHPWYTRIESETAVWAPEIFRQHFFEIADRYVAALLRGHAAGELADYEERELEVIAYILMAARHYLATRYLAGVPGARLPSAVVNAYVDLVSRGLLVAE